MKIYFTIDKHDDLLDSQPLRALCGWHWWKLEDGDTAFGVAIPHRLDYAEDTAEMLQSLGATVLPALTDTDSPIPDGVHDKLKKHGVNPGQHKTTKDIAKTMHTVSGFKPFRPTLL